MQTMHKYFLLLFGTLLLFSCDSGMVYDEYQSIDNSKWASENKIEFIVSNTDTISSKNVFITIRNNKNYEFSSLFLIAKIEFPKGLRVVDTLEYEMADAQGKWLGSGFTDVKENKLFYKENVVFTEKGDYKFSIQHATRSIHDIEGENPLNGITDVGLSIEKVN
ncbi:protein involved in gliding motility GldH [Lutibacter agarilyticus]|uniref:Protein involved in gliding motility GldH n=1 Tax=Lutibacter agarilyticus TaxID=1109740 RepID=A0A238VW02_9FLAO|nr:gliding motility lipoprotein GldH [Lutibacter agarilyticus]SNR38317.1 protein involved in gliding motility GldH [Lutibacter agarilyticus]